MLSRFTIKRTYIWRVGVTAELAGLSIYLSHTTSLTDDPTLVPDVCGPVCTAATLVRFAPVGIARLARHSRANIVIVMQIPVKWSSSFHLFQGPLLGLPLRGPATSEIGWHWSNVGNVLWNLNIRASMFWKTKPLYLKISLLKNSFSMGLHLLVKTFKMAQNSQ